MKHLLFLSHSGIDSEAALALARRLEACPEAEEHGGLKVWIDKIDLPTGGRWKLELEQALATATAFVVYTGSQGIANWVRYEVDIALDRAHKDREFPLIPVLAPGADAGLLPGLLAQYQGVLDVEGNPDAFAKLLRGVLRLEPRAKVESEREPFLGLNAFESRKAHLFFGREEETRQVLDLLRSESLVMVTGDSGSGKSSLVKAGVVPAFRGGALAPPREKGPDETVWYTLETRPGLDPFQELADQVLFLASRLGRPSVEANDLAKLVNTKNPDDVRNALLLCTRPPGELPGRLLIVVDQFEEIRSRDDAGAFVATLLRIVDAGDDRIRVVLTMRRDYYATCRRFSELFDRLERNQRRALYLLRRMSSEGLRACVVRPLALTTISPSESDDLAGVILNDVTNEAGELALLEMALARTWSARSKHTGLVSAYAAIGRVEGALAQAAEEVFSTLSAEERSLAEPLFVRLVWPGEPGGVTRRIARFEELDEVTQSLARKLATREQERLLTLGAATVEMTHEQLATQWVRCQEWISNYPEDPRGEDLRLLHRLISDSRRWNETEGLEKEDCLAKGADLKAYGGLSERRTTWLFGFEHRFVESSNLAEEAAKIEEDQRRRRERRSARIVKIFALLVLSFSVIASVSYLDARRANVEKDKVIVDLKLQQAKERADAIFDGITEWNDANWDEVEALWRLSAFSNAEKIEFLRQATGPDERKRRKALNREGSLRRALSGIKRNEARWYSRSISSLGGRQPEDGVTAVALAAALDPNNEAAQIWLLERIVLGVEGFGFSSEDVDSWLRSIGRARPEIKQRILTRMLETRPSCEAGSANRLLVRNRLLVAISGGSLSEFRILEEGVRTLEATTDCLREHKISILSAAESIEPLLNSEVGSNLRYWLERLANEVLSESRSGDENRMASLLFFCRFGFSPEQKEATRAISGLVSSLKDQTFVLKLLGQLGNIKTSDSEVSSGRLEMNSELADGLARGIAGMTDPGEVIEVSAGLARVGAGIPTSMQSAITEKLEFNLRGFIYYQPVVDSLEVIGAFSTAISTERRSNLIDTIVRRLELSRDPAEFGALCRSLKRIGWKLSSSQSRRVSISIVGHISRCRSFNELVTYVQAGIDVVRRLDSDDRDLLPTLKNSLEGANDRFGDVTPCDEKIVGFASNIFKKILIEGGETRLDLIFSSLAGPGSLNLDGQDLKEAASSFEALNAVVADQDMPQVRGCILDGLQQATSVQQHRLSILAVNALDKDLTWSESIRVKLNFLKYPEISDDVERLILESVGGKLPAGSGSEDQYLNVIYLIRPEMERFAVAPPVSPDKIQARVIEGW